MSLLLLFNQHGRAVPPQPVQPARPATGNNLFVVPAILNSLPVAPPTRVQQTFLIDQPATLFLWLEGPFLTEDILPLKFIRPDGSIYFVDDSSLVYVSLVQGKFYAVYSTAKFELNQAGWWTTQVNQTSLITGNYYFYIAPFLS